MNGPDTLRTPSTGPSSTTFGTAFELDTSAHFHGKSQGQSAQHDHDHDHEHGQDQETYDAIGNAQESPEEWSKAAFSDTAAMTSHAKHHCKHCGGILLEGRAYELGGYRWHVDCFLCSVCGSQMNEQTNMLVLGNGTLVCNKCSYYCNICQKKIQDLAILSNDQAFCSACFSCRNCKKRIDDLKYARTSQGIFCMSCHNMLLAKKKQRSGERSKTGTKDEKRQSMNPRSVSNGSQRSSYIKDKQLPDLPGSSRLGTSRSTSSSSFATQPSSNGDTSTPSSRPTKPSHVSAPVLPTVASASMDFARPASHDAALRLGSPIDTKALPLSSAHLDSVFEKLAASQDEKSVDPLGINLSNDFEPTVAAGHEPTPEDLEDQPPSSSSSRFSLHENVSSTSSAENVNLSLTKPPVAHTSVPESAAAAAATSPTLESSGTGFIDDSRIPKRRPLRRGVPGPINLDLADDDATPDAEREPLSASTPPNNRSTTGLGAYPEAGLDTPAGLPVTAPSSAVASPINSRPISPIRSPGFGGAATGNGAGLMSSPSFTTRPFDSNAPKQYETKDPKPVLPPSTSAADFRLSDSSMSTGYGDRVTGSVVSSPQPSQRDTTELLATPREKLLNSSEPNEPASAQSDAPRRGRSDAPAPRRLPMVGVPDISSTVATPSATSKQPSATTDSAATPVVTAMSPTDGSSIFMSPLSMSDSTAGGSELQVPQRSAFRAHSPMKDRLAGSNRSVVETERARHAMASMSLSPRAWMNGLGRSGSVASKSSFAGAISAPILQYTSNSSVNDDSVSAPMIPELKSAARSHKRSHSDMPLGEPSSSLLMRNLRVAQQRIFELEQALASKNTDPETKTRYDSDVLERKKTIAGLEARKIVAEEQLEALAGARDTASAGDVLTDFSRSLEKVRGRLETEIAELAAKKEDLITEVDQLVSARDKALEESSILNIKNSQLVDMNNELLKQTIEKFGPNTLWSSQQPPPTSPGAGAFGVGPAAGPSQGSSQNKIFSRRDKAKRKEVGSGTQQRPPASAAAQELGPNSPYAMSNSSSNPNFHSHSTETLPGVSSNGASTSSFGHYADPQGGPITPNLSAVSNLGQPGATAGASGLGTPADGPLVTVLDAPAGPTSKQKGARNIWPWRRPGKGLTRVFATEVTDEDPEYGIGSPMPAQQQNLNGGMPGPGGAIGMLAASFSQSGGLTGPVHAHAHSVNLSSSNSIIGDSLEQRLAIDEASVPLLVSRCIDEVERRGLELEGIYRKSGSKSQVDSIIEHFETNDPATEHCLDLDISAVTSALKQYLRYLVDPVITYQYYDLYVEAGRTSDLSLIRDVVMRLPPAHRQTLEVLARHLSTVSTYGTKNLMTARNLAVVFAPTLARDRTGEREVLDMQARNDATQMLIERVGQIFA